MLVGLGGQDRAIVCCPPELLSPAAAAAILPARRHESQLRAESEIAVHDPCPEFKRELRRCFLDPLDLGFVRRNRRPPPTPVLRPGPAPDGTFHVVSCDFTSWYAILA